MSDTTAQVIESALDRLDQYGLVLIRDLPSSDRLFCDAVLGRFSHPILLTDLSDLTVVQQQLARALGSASSPESILAATRQLNSAIPVVIFADQISIPVLQYLIQLGAVVDNVRTRLPVLLLETPGLSAIWQTAEGAALKQRVALTLSVEPPARTGWHVSLAVGVLLTGGAFLGYMVGWSKWTTSPEPVAEIVETAKVPPEQTRVQPAVDAVPANQKVPLLSDQDRLNVHASIEQWRLGWQQQNWDNYVRSYIDYYLPLDDDITHEQWAGWRRARIEKPDWIRVKVDELKLYPLDYYQVRAVFRQYYEAPGYQDSAVKELYLVRLGQEWRINAERSLSAMPQ